jgi:hypothetical protein
MSGLAWGGLAIGLVIVASAVGIPYFLTHRRMRDHHDVTDSHAYLRARRRWVWQRRARGVQAAPIATDARGQEGSSPH